MRCSESCPSTASYRTILRSPSHTDDKVHSRSINLNRKPIHQLPHPNRFPHRITKPLMERNPYLRSPICTAPPSNPTMTTTPLPTPFPTLHTSGKPRSLNSRRINNLPPKEISFLHGEYLVFICCCTCLLGQGRRCSWGGGRCCGEAVVLSIDDAAVCSS